MAQRTPMWGTIRSGTRDLLPSVFQVESDIPQDTECLYWLPNSEELEVQEAIPGIGFRCDRNERGVRQILPIGFHSDRGIRKLFARKSFSRNFFFAAHYYGLEILCRHSPEQFTGEQLFSYRIMWFLFQRARRMRQSISRHFEHKKDLELTVAVREDMRIDNILPWIGSEAAGALGYPRNLDEFLDIGHREAVAHGIDAPKLANKIEFGLFHAVKLEDRVPLAVDDASRLVRSTLFEIDYSEDSLPDDLVARVEQLILEQIEPHVMNDETQAKFDDWFAGGNSKLVTAVSRKLKDFPEKEATAIVTSVLVEYGWRAYQYLTTCIQAIMCDVANALPEPLSAEEQACFELLYYPQPYFGGLPLILLGDRLEVVRLIARQLLESPTDLSLIGDLHCLLQFLSAMVSQRRRADRERKTPRKTFSYDESD